MKGLQILLSAIVVSVVIDVVRSSGDCPICCGYGAVCHHKQCKCLDGRVGNPLFACYNPTHYYYCEIASDPMINAFDNQNSSLKMPQAISLTELATRRFGTGSGQCHFNLDAWTTRFGGKFFIEGFQFKLIQSPNGYKSSTLEFLIVFKVVNGVYTWDVHRRSGSHWYLQHKISSRVYTSTCHGCRIVVVQTASKFLHVNIACCSIKFGIRPFNPDRPTKIPGIFVNVRKWAHMLSLPKYLCNNVTDSPNFDNLVQQYGFDTRFQMMTYNGLTYGPLLNFVGAFPQMASLQHMLRTCPDSRRSDFMTKAEFLFRYENLIACMEDDIMPLTYEVIKGFCDNNSTACTNAIRGIRTRCPGQNENDNLNAFLHHGCAP